MSDEFKNTPVSSSQSAFDLHDKIITDILKREKIHQSASKLGTSSLFLSLKKEKIFVQNEKHSKKVVQNWIHIFS